MSDRCDKTDLLKDQCAHCLGHLGADKEEEQNDKEFDKWLNRQEPG